jgi:HEPN domain-containing protein
MRPEHVAETRHWLTLAREDLQVAGLLLTETRYLGPILFPCQQAAEKALKGFLIWHDRPFRRTHDLVELVNQCAVVAPEFAVLRAPADILTPYAVDARYPESAGRLTVAEALEAHRLAQQILTFALDRLPPEVNA